MRYNRRKWKLLIGWHSLAQCHRVLSCSIWQTTKELGPHVLTLCLHTNETPPMLLLLVTEKRLFQHRKVYSQNI